MTEEFTGFHYHQPSDGDDDHHRFPMNDPNSYLFLSEFFDGSPPHDQIPFSCASALSPEAVSVVAPTTSISSTPENNLHFYLESNKGNKEAEETLDKGKKGGDQKKKQQQQTDRFAFMTKSEVDHLEDGYRWRKYGQKAVKNNAYPRSYYRCTTLKCLVKKRVERSFEDPSVVVTTYEGRHNHRIPVALRGHAAAPSSSSSLSRELVHADDQMLYGYGDVNTTTQHDQFPDRGLLQDIILPNSKQY